MDENQLGVCLAEIRALIRRLGSTAIVDLIVCDAAVAAVQKIRATTPMTLAGGGGTDMRVGIQAAAEASPTPDLVITLTDGFTPWPEVPPEKAKNARYVAVIIAKEEQGSRNRSSRLDKWKPPEWMHTIHCAASA
jgi:predicted metal-dependent peptidase